MEPLILAEMLCFPSFLSFCSFCLLLPIAHVASGPLGSTDWFSNIRAFTRLPWLGRRGQRGVADVPQDLLAFPLSRRKRLGAMTFRSTFKTKSSRDGPPTHVTTRMDPYDITLGESCTVYDVMYVVHPEGQVHRQKAGQRSAGAEGGGNGSDTNGSGLPLGMTEEGLKCDYDRCTTL